jgi:hypothetical protein
MLRPICAVIARHDEAHRIAIEPRELFTVHLIGDHHFPIACVVDIQRFEKVGRRRERGLVEAVENDLASACLNPGLVKKRLQRHDTLAGISHCAVRKLPTAYSRFEKSPAVPRTLRDGDNLDWLEARLEFGQGYGESPVDFPADSDPIRPGIDRQRNVR